MSSRINPAAIFAYNSATARSKQGRAVFACVLLAICACCYQGLVKLSDVLWVGLALMLVFEGILPFVAPQAWKDTFRRILALPDNQLRLAGLASMLAGLIMLYWMS